jgi:type II secretory pathway pseudopilin PulG
MGEDLSALDSNRPMKPIPDRSSERGVTLLELILAALLISTVVASLLKLFSVSQRGGVTMRSEVRASALARNKLDELKNLARKSSLDGTFANITRSSKAQAFSVTQVAVVSGKAYTWRVSATFASQNLTQATDVTSNTVTSRLLHLEAWTGWSDQSQARALTIEAYVADQTR